MNNISFLCTDLFKKRGHFDIKVSYKRNIFTQEIPPGGVISGLGRGGGAAGERGRGRGRGFFDRHRSQVDDEDGVGRREEGGGRGFGGRGT